MKRSMMVSALAALAFAGTTLAVGTTTRDVDQPEIRRDGVGEKRVTLNKMELTPFDVTTLNKLSKWQNGEAPSAEALRDKVVAVVMWANWRPTSLQAAQQLAALSESSKGQLVVIAAHDAKMWDEGMKLASERGVKTLIAHDEKGEFRRSLKSDQNPEVYFIDRAGQLRFADVEIGSVNAAAEALLKETTEEAKGRLGVIASNEKTARDKSAMTREAKNVVRPGEKLTVTFKIPEDAAFEALLWPKKNNKELVQSMANDIQGQKWPVKFGAEEVWLKGEVPDTRGRVMLVDFWATWCPPCVRAMPDIQKIHEAYAGKGVRVIGVNCWENGDAVKFKKDKGYTYGLLLKGDDVATGYGVQGIPAFFVIGKTGRIVAAQSGFSNDLREVLTKAIDKALAE